eukprot:1330991-Amphidinium_carterae.1
MSLARKVSLCANVQDRSSTVTTSHTCLRPLTSTLPTSSIANLTQEIEANNGSSNHPKLPATFQAVPPTNSCLLGKF